jgi:cell division protein FtsB
MRLKEKELNSTREQLAKEQAKFDALQANCDQIREQIIDLSTERREL